MAEKKDTAPKEEQPKEEQEDQKRGPKPIRPGGPFKGGTGVHKKG